jgi:hypothetical protein
MFNILTSMVWVSEERPTSAANHGFVLIYTIVNDFLPTYNVETTLS